MQNEDDPNKQALFWTSIPVNSLHHVHVPEKVTDVQETGCFSEAVVLSCSGDVR